MRLHRFYVLQPLGEEVVIDDVSLVKQWIKVFRYTKGDLVILFNGEGTDVTYSLESITHKSITLSRISISPSYIPVKKITLCLSVIKKDNFELVVQKATELGVSTIIPILSERSEKKNIQLERLQKVAIESAEQSGRGDVPTILPIIPLGELLNSLPPCDELYALQMNEPTLQDTHKGGSVALFIGPEGGWSDKEKELFEKNGVTLSSLVPSTLRAETAAIVAIAFVIN